MAHRKLKKDRKSLPLAGLSRCSPLSWSGRICALISGWTLLWHKAAHSKLLSLQFRQPVLPMKLLCLCQHRGFQDQHILLENTMCIKGEKSIFCRFILERNRLCNSSFFFPSLSVQKRTGAEVSQQGEMKPGARFISSNFCSRVQQGGKTQDPCTQTTIMVQRAKPVFP